MPESAEAALLAARLEARPLDELLAQARALAHDAHGVRVSYSRKVFIPLTRLCRDSCAYCTFATTPSKLQRPYLSQDEVLAIARAGQAAGCREALFTLGDKPELRYAAARDALAGLGHATTIDYVEAMCRLVLRETTLLPHVNAGAMPREDIARLREVSVSQGLMLESISERLFARGGPHFGSPDKAPAARLEMLHAAGELAVPFTTGILIGIGETRLERIESLLAIRDAQRRHGHVQEVIVQNFCPKPGTRMAGCEETAFDDLLWTVAAARLILGAEANLQVPPNLSDRRFPQLLQAGINDWGGISPVTPDHVNPEKAWPTIPALERATRDAGHVLVERLASYPAYCRDAARWHAPDIATRLRHAVDADGLARTDDWLAGRSTALPAAAPRRAGTEILGGRVREAIARATDGERLDEDAMLALFAARGDDVHAVCEAADRLRRDTVGDVVRYVVNRNINYTNVCQHRCRFCAFAKGRSTEDLRGAPYDLSLDEVARRVREAWDRGATEVCMQGGIHPAYTGDTYVEICRAVKAACPSMHVHAFSPLEVLHGAASSGVEVPVFLRRLRDAGLGTLPGTAAEILDDEVRAVICPDKLDTRQWLDVMEAAHRLGLRSTATMMFGHVERPIYWVRHLQRVRALQERTGGFTEFVPLPYVHQEAPMHRQGLSRRGPTFREALLVHAVARLALHPVLPHIQTSWVKMGAAGAQACLRAGASDLGGTLMNESISRAAGTVHGQELPPEDMDELVRAIGRTPCQRTTLYTPVPEDRRAASYSAPPVAPVVLTPLTRRRVASRVEVDQPT